MVGWGPLDKIHGLWDTISGQSTIVVRVEPFLTWTTKARVANLPLEEEDVSFADQQAVFTGKVINNLGSSIINGLVTAVIRRKSSAEIVAAGIVHLNITDSVAPGQILIYNLAVPLPTNLNPATVDTEVTAWGQQP
jgi:hypothetical protein